MPNKLLTTITCGVACSVTQFLKLSNDSASYSIFGMDVEVIVLLQIFNKNKLKNRTKTFLDKFFLNFVVKFKLEFTAALRFKAPISTLIIGSF